MSDNRLRYSGFWSGLIIAAGGGLLALAAFGDRIGVGSAGFGPRQTGGLIVGALLVGAGAILLWRGLKKKTLFWGILFALIGFFVFSAWGILNLFTGRFPLDTAEAELYSIFGVDNSNEKAEALGLRFKPRKGDTLYYFPYGMLGRFPGLSLNSLGFRIPLEIEEIRGRYPSERLIAVMGGSGAYSIAVRDNDKTFASILGNLLNEDEAMVPGHQSSKFIVLNFAMPSVTILNEMSYYQLFIEPLKPEIVIAHDGFNDLFYSQVSDPYLLANHGITYPMQSQGWADILYRYPRILRSRTEKPPVINDDATVIVDAFGQRVHQFQTMVESSGASFIHGLQPWFFTENHPCGYQVKAERERVGNDLFADSQWRHNYQAELYDTYVRRILTPAPGWFVDIHSEFQARGSDECLFADPEHQNEAGEEATARAYYTKIREVLLSK